MSGNLILCGFMGCGKTSVGRRAAGLLGLEFCDLDQYIQQKWEMSITEIFARYGEEGFRQREAQAAREVADMPGLIIASGGGTVLAEKNVEAFHKSGGRIVFLDAPLPALQERLKNDKRRPLLQVPNRRQVIAGLYRKRIPLYRAAADVTVNAGAPPSVVAQRVAALVENGAG